MRNRSSYTYKALSARHIHFSFIVFNNDNDDNRCLLNSETRSLRVPRISFPLVDLAKNNINNNNDYCLLNDYMTGPVLSTICALTHLCLWELSR